MAFKAITTRYFGPGNVRGARIIASDEDGNRLSVPYPHSIRGGVEECHRAAAQALADKMGWGGELIAGSLKDGYVFVFPPEELAHA